MTDPLEELEATSRVLPAAVAGVRLGDRATQRLQRFSDAGRHELRLKAFVELAILLDGHSDAQVKEQVGRALDAAFEVSKAMEEVCDEQTLEDAFEEYPTFIQSLGVLEGQLRPLWTRTIDRQFAPLGSVGALLSAFPGARDLGLKMVQAAADARHAAHIPLIDLAPTVTLGRVFNHVAKHLARMPTPLVLVRHQELDLGGDESIDPRGIDVKLHPLSLHMIAVQHRRTSRWVAEPLAENHWVQGSVLHHYFSVSAPEQSGHS
jgi:hypothetical protein